MRAAEFPPPLKRGDRVGVAALSGPVDLAALEAGIETLRSMGLEPVPGSNLRSKSGMFAGSDGERVEAFTRLVRDASLKAILFARGGHGILRVLPAIDWSALERHPRAYVGYSDVTPLLNQIVDRLGLVAFHGPMVAVECAEGLRADEEESLWSLLSGARRFRIPVEGAAGSARGVLKGGCLSLLTATLGTEFATDLRGSIVFWEDVAEPAYRLDRMLTQLKLSGSLAGIKAMIAGRVELLESESGEGGFSELMRGFGAELRCPTAWGAASGHCRPNLTMPLGAEVVLDARAGVLELEAGDR